MALIFVARMSGIFFGVYILTKDGSTKMLLWTFGWTIGGILTFFLSFWWKLGIQKIELSDLGIKITKRLGQIRFSKLIRSSKITSLHIEKFEPINPFTGKQMKVAASLGWLVISNAPHYFIHSFLYKINDLNEFIAEWKLKNSYSTHSDTAIHMES
ncbi:hypothetical protein [uncultured Imperialibacter sp.]|uniref:hypothetical protein n=1 Tax=uncultured Imperialibacter sp. TaxID=1672639 RepID=UPI0030DB37D8